MSAVREMPGFEGHYGLLEGRIRERLASVRLTICTGRTGQSHRRGEREVDDGPHQSPTGRPGRGCGRRRHDAGRAVGPSAEGTADPPFRGGGGPEDLRSRLDDRL